jgi:hypothetical protein
MNGRELSEALMGGPEPSEVEVVREHHTVHRTVLKRTYRQLCGRLALMALST